MHIYEHFISSVQSLSRVWLFVTPRTLARQAPPSMGFSKQEYWSGGAIAFSDVPTPIFKIDNQQGPTAQGIWFNIL